MCAGIIARADAPGAIPCGTVRLDLSRVLRHAGDVELRPYQRECLRSLAARYKAGMRRLLVSLPTGTGKTVIFAHFPQFFAMKRRLLVLAHRQELLEQAARKFQASGTLSVGIEQADQHAGSAQIVVASVPSLKGTRLSTLDPEQFYLVVVDEAHHAVAPSYRAIFAHLGLLERDSRKLLVGFTATPRRGDRRGLGEVFQEIAYSKGIEEMIRDGYLCRISGWRVHSDVDLDSVRVRAGDFVESSLADAVDNVVRNELVVAAYERLAKGRRCIAFCVNVEHARHLADDFRRMGFRAQAVWGAMPPGERASVLSALRDGDLDVVTNCNVLTEGFDEPSVSCVLMARPTRSLGLYVQMVGRGTRLFQGKQDLLVIDVADNSRKHTLAGLHALFDLPDGLELQGSDALQMADRVRGLAVHQPWVDVELLRRPEDLDLAAERIDFFRLEPPRELVGVTDLAWLKRPGSGYRLCLPGEGEYLVRPTLLGDWEIVRVEHGVETIVGREANAVAGVIAVDDRVHTRHSDALRVLSQSASWRKLPPTEKQLALLRARKVPIPSQISRGQASWLLSYVMR